MGGLKHLDCFFCSLCRIIPYYCSLLPIPLFIMSHSLLSILHNYLIFSTFNMHSLFIMSYFAYFSLYIYYINVYHIRLKNRLYM